MARYGFVIDQTKCIGCHACTVACKMEHRVPLGVFRTWVKYVERGSFPDVRRSFAVLRCNHCEDAPCVTICPTRSLFRREDGIVDFDPERCIGCKSCMQACPYDALAIDPKSHTAAKCNFCAHRVERNMAPACEVVCPTHAIVSGDVEDPSTQIAKILREEQVSVRAPEQRTGPNVFYVGADRAALTAEAVRQGKAYLWSTIVPDAQTLNRDNGSHASGAPELAHEATTTYNVAHPAMWGWKVSAYLVTKSVAAGVAGVALLALAVGLRATGMLGAAAPILALALAALTGFLLVWDLKRPERFLYIFLKPNPRSWLMWGAWVLMAFCGALVGWAFGALGGPSWMQTLGRAATVPLAPLAAGYSGWLFNQAEGRDLWQSPLLHLHLVVMAAATGAAALALAAPLIGGPEHMDRLLAWVLTGSSALHGLLLALELGRRHPTANGRIAARNLVRGPFAAAFRSGVVLSAGVAGVGAAAAAVTEARPLMWLAAVCSLAGVWLYEDAWVRAGQSAPLS